MNKKVLSLLMGSILSLGLTVGCSSTNAINDKVIEEGTIETGGKFKNKEELFILEDGVYEVGTDIAAGEYLILASTPDAYFELSSDDSGDTESILFNDMFSKNRYLTVQEGQYLTLEECKLIKLEDRVLNVDAMLTDGMFKVGVDIPSGEYKIKANEVEGYYEITPTSEGKIYSLISDGSFMHQKNITVKDGQYLKLSKNTTLIK